MPYRTTAVAIALFLGIRAASATPQEAQAIERQAEQAEKRGDPVAALALYERALHAEPDASMAHVARARVEYFRSHSEGDFKPLAILMQAQARPLTEVTREQLEQLDAQVAAFPPGEVQRTARAYVAMAWRMRFHDVPRAEATYRALLADAALSKGEREMAASGWSATLLEAGHPLRALAVAREQGIGRTTEYRDIETAAISDVGHPIAWAALVVFGVVACFVVFRAPVAQTLRRTFRPANLLLAAYVVVPPWILAVAFQGTLQRVFAPLALSLAVVILVATAMGEALRAKPSPPWKFLAAASTLAACLGAGFFALARSEMLIALLLWRGL